MKLTIKTTLLKSLLTKANTCVSNNKMDVKTMMVGFTLENNKLTLTTTDGNNYMFVSTEIVNEDFCIVTYMDTIYKLVSKTTSPTISLEVKDSSLIIKGNGMYTAELPLDETGKVISHLPNPLPAPDETRLVAEISKESIESILKANKNSLSTSLSTPCYTGYYIKDAVITGDGYKICFNDINLLEDAILVSPSTMNLLTGSVKLWKSNTTDEIVIVGADYVVYAHTMEYVNDFKADALANFAKQDLPYYCEINRNTLSCVLDRLSLFISPYDNNMLKLSFSNDGLTITNKKSNSGEKISFNNTGENGEFTCNVSYELLKTQVNSQSGDTVELWYGDNKFLRFVDGDVTEIVALANE